MDYFDRRICSIFSGHSNHLIVRVNQYWITSLILDTGQGAWSWLFSAKLTGLSAKLKQNLSSLISRTAAISNDFFIFLDMQLISLLLARVLSKLEPKSKSFYYYDFRSICDHENKSSSWRCSDQNPVWWKSTQEQTKQQRKSNLAVFCSHGFNKYATPFSSKNLKD